MGRRHRRSIINFLPHYRPVARVWFSAVNRKSLSPPLKVISASEFSRQSSYHCYSENASFPEPRLPWLINKHGWGEYSFHLKPPGKIIKICLKNLLETQQIRPLPFN